MAKAGMITFTGQLLKELANAVLGWRRDGPMWFVVAETGGDYTLLGDPATPDELAFWDEGAAHIAMAKYEGKPPEDATLGVFGPYESTRSSVGFDLKVKEVIVELDGRRLPNRPIKDGADMIVWTPAAFDKFVAPYYFELGSAEPKAFRDIQKLRRDCFGRGKSGMMIHYWPTRSVGYDDHGEWSVVGP